LIDQLNGLHVLVVEDNPANLLLTQAVLQRSRCRISVAGSAEDVDRQIIRELPDVILMDIQLPGQDGLAITRQLKADPSTAAIPIIALTAHAMKEDQERVYQAGCDGYMAKPISIRTFAGELALILDRTRQARER
jgi:CheY-like chemotaxis protein